MPETLSQTEEQDFAWQEDQDFSESQDFPESKKKRAAEIIKRAAKKSAKAAQILLLAGVASVTAGEIFLQSDAGKDYLAQIDATFNLKDSGQTENLKYIEDVLGRAEALSIIESPDSGSSTQTETRKPAALQVEAKAFNDPELNQNLENLIIDFEKTLPSSYINQPEAMKIEYVKSLKFDPNYGHKIAALAEVTGLHDRSGVVKVSSSTFLKDDFGRVIIHESAHQNDWESSKLLTKSQKLDLLASVLRRVTSAERFKAPMLEDIDEENSQEELYDKCVEYWAVIVENYFDNPELLPGADRELVEKTIKLTDPDYNFQEARQKQQDIRARAGVVIKSLKKANGHI